MSDEERARQVQRALLEAGYGPNMDLAHDLLYLAAGIFVMEGHGKCAPEMLEHHLSKWQQAFEREKP